MKNTSLSLRLTAWFSTIFLVGFALFGVVMWVDLAYSLGQGRDRTLTRRAARITELLDATSGDTDNTREVRFEQLTDVIPEGHLIEVLDGRGKLVLPRNQKAPDFPWPAPTGLPAIALATSITTGGSFGCTGTRAILMSFWWPASSTTTAT